MKMLSSDKARWYIEKNSKVVIYNYLHMPHLRDISQLVYSEYEELEKSRILTGEEVIKILEDYDKVTYIQLEGYFSPATYIDNYSADKVLGSNSGHPDHYTPNQVFRDNGMFILVEDKEDFGEIGDTYNAEGMYEILIEHNSERTLLVGDKKIYNRPYKITPYLDYYDEVKEGNNE